MEPNEMDVAELKKSWATRRKAARPQAISGSQEDWVGTGFLSADGELPLVVEPKLRSVDLPAWLASNMPWVESRLERYGGILFRGFGLSSQADFERAVAATGIELMNYVEGATPRTEIGQKVYTSTEYPSAETIFPHNELCYVATWPMKIWFYCLVEPQDRGETPIVDMRRVLRRIDPQIVEEFRRKGWMLVRNFGDGFGPTWQHSYREHDREALEAYFRNADIQFEWKGGDRLRTRQVRPAIARHPKTGEEVWFNHVVFWHVSELKPDIREAFLAEFGEQDLPYNTYFGDGTPIDKEVIAQIGNAYNDELAVFPWRQGDFLFLDNMLVAHGRSPFTGPRRILTAMGQPESRRG
jgi:alpha-ketoglutarate-dependent taurine dioxygenase